MNHQRSDQRKYNKLRKKSGNLQNLISDKKNDIINVFRDLSETPGEFMNTNAS